MSLSDAIIAEAYRVLRTGQYKNSRAASLAESVLLDQIDCGALSEAKAFKILGNSTRVAVYVKKFQDEIDKESAVLEKTKEAHREARLARIELTATDTHQASQRIETQLSKLHSITAELQTAAANLIAQTAESAVTLRDVFKATSTRTALILGFTVGFFSGLPSGFISGLGSNYIYERHFSIDALKEKAPAASAPPLVPAKITEAPQAATVTPENSSLPSSNAVRLYAGPYGLHDPASGQSMLELLQMGRGLILPMSNSQVVCFAPAASTLLTEAQPPLKPVNHYVPRNLRYKSQQSMKPKAHAETRPG